MLCLRRVAFRAVSSSPSNSIAIKARSLTSRTYPLSISRTPTLPKATFFPLQRRYATDEAAIQAEPEADGATEAQHGENSIAASADADADANAPEPATEHEEAAAQSTTDYAIDSAQEQASSAGSQVANAAHAATETVKGAAEGLAAAAGFGSVSARLEPPREDLDSPPEVGVSKTVYIGNLYFDVRAEGLKQEFSRAGEIINVKVIMDRRGLSKGFGYIEFADVPTATKAIDLFNDQPFEGRRLTVQYSLSRSPRPNIRDPDGPMHPPTKTLFIGNMSFDMSDRDLNDLFRNINNVVDVRVAIDRRTGQPRGFAHAEFVNIESAEIAAAELKGRIVCGRELRVDYSTSTGRRAGEVAPA